MTVIIILRKYTIIRYNPPFAGGDRAAGRPGGGPDRYRVAGRVVGRVAGVSGLCGGAGLPAAPLPAGHHDQRQ